MVHMFEKVSSENTWKPRIYERFEEAHEDYKKLGVLAHQSPMNMWEKIKETVLSNCRITVRGGC